MSLKKITYTGSLNKSLTHNLKKEYFFPIKSLNKEKKNYVFKQNFPTQRRKSNYLDLANEDVSLLKLSAVACMTLSLSLALSHTLTLPLSLPISLSLSLSSLSLSLVCSNFCFSV